MDSGKNRENRLWSGPETRIFLKLFFFKSISNSESKFLFHYFFSSILFFSIAPKYFCIFSYLLPIIRTIQNNIILFQLLLYSLIYLLLNFMFITYEIILVFENKKILKKTDFRCRAKRKSTQKWCAAMMDVWFQMAFVLQIYVQAACEPGKIKISFLFCLLSFSRGGCSEKKVKKNKSATYFLLTFFFCGWLYS